ncbi:hypothetical protein NA8A_19625 [Nitratireductor indicus C115]|uniref:Uncharacterized protein n=1 Tax=Nitratireductor indicus C115 TaxID=1231190 RepID=K2PHL1_9HYPH|nr:hypothetical protein NA8A_19625 [Nitratireductor indicus C115]
MVKAMALENRGEPRDDISSSCPVSWSGGSGIVSAPQIRGLWIFGSALKTKGPPDDLRRITACTICLTALLQRSFDAFLESPLRTRPYEASNVPVSERFIFPFIYKTLSEIFIETELAMPRPTWIRYEQVA